MSSIEEQMAKILSEEIQKAIDQEILMAISAEPKLVFRRYTKGHQKYELEYGMEFSAGTFTPTGLRDYHLADIKAWCVENDCGQFVDFYRIVFRDEKEMAWFLLRWS